MTETLKFDIISVKKSMKKNFSFILFILLSLSLFFIFPLKIYENKQIKLIKSIEIKNFTTILKETPDGYIYNNKECYYFSFKTNSVLKHPVKDKNFLTANLNGFIEYEKENKKLYLYNNKGNFISIIENKGLPYLPNEKEIFASLKPDGRGFSLYYLDGKLILDEINFDSLITSIDFDNKNILISTIDGETILLNNNKEILFKIQNNEDVPQLNAISNNGDFIAISYGVINNYIDIYDIKNQKLITRIENKKNNIKRISFLKFVKEKLYFENNDKIFFYNLKKKQLYNIKTKGKLKEITFNKEKLLVLTEDNTVNYLYLFNTDGILLLYKELNNEISNVKFINENAFYFKYQDKILYLSI